MDLSPFRIERFYARYEHSTRFMLSSSDCESRTVGDLLELEPGGHERLLETWCGYTEPLGDPGLRQAIAALYERLALMRWSSPRAPRRASSCSTTPC